MMPIKQEVDGRDKSQQEIQQPLTGGGCKSDSETEYIADIDIAYSLAVQSRDGAFGNLYRRRSNQGVYIINDMVQIRWKVLYKLLTLIGCQVNEQRNDQPNHSQCEQSHDYHDQNTRRAGIAMHGGNKGIEQIGENNGNHKRGDNIASLVKQHQAKHQWNQPVEAES